MKQQGLMLLIAALLSTGTALAQQTAPATPPAPPPGVELKFSAQPETATVGDPITIEFDLSMPRGFQARFPPVGNELGDFTILEFNAGSSTDEKPSDPSAVSAKAHHRARIVAALYRVGEFEFHPIPVIVRDAEGREHSISTPSIRIRIQSVLSGKDESLKDLKKQAEIPEPSRWILWLSLALLALLIGALGWWWWNRRKLKPDARLPSQPEMDPLDAADAELRDLISRGLLEKGFVKEFYVSLSEIIKKILEAAYSIQTFEKTTSEIMESLRGRSQAAESPGLDNVEALLINCDLVKFAKYVPPRSETEGTVRNTMELLNASRKLRESPPAQPAPVTAETT